jgi:hypothetical protein
MTKVQTNLQTTAMAQTQTHCEGHLPYLKKTDHMQDLNWKLTYLQTHIMVLSF